MHTHKKEYLVLPFIEEAVKSSHNHHLAVYWRVAQNKAIMLRQNELKVCRVTFPSTTSYHYRHSTKPYRTNCVEAEQ